MKNLPRNVSRLLGLLLATQLLLWTSPSVLANSNHLAVQQYPDARVMFSVREHTQDYLLALGSLKKIQDTWRAERYQRLSGELQRFTLELPSGHSAQAGFDFYLTQLQGYNLRELYSCVARACGASNAWANNHFKILQLYGLDQHQQYAAYEVITESLTPYYVAIYSVQRGNRRVYVQVDILNSDKSLAGGVAANPDTVIELLQVQGFYRYPDPVTDAAEGGTRLKVSNEHLQTLVMVLNRQPGWRIALVGHDYQGATLAAQQQASLVYAQQLQQALVDAGVSASRLSSQGLGGLAPAGRGDLSARVEVVLLP